MMNSGEEKSFQERPNLLWYDSITSTLTIGGKITVVVTSICSATKISYKNQHKMSRSTLDD